MDHNNGDSRAIKRIRQACVGCRKRKIRCSGERPTCAYCQTHQCACVYEPASSTEPQTPSASTVPSRVEPDLLSRISSIEATLNSLSQQRGLNSPQDAFRLSPATNLNNEIHETLFTGLASPSSEQISGSNPPAGATPSPEALRSLLDTYFTRLHNRPYSFFHHESFMQRLSRNTVPTCLLLAVRAMAVRFSHHPAFEGRTVELSNTYSQQAWKRVIDDHLSFEENLDLSVIQTVTILAIVDYTAGKVRSGWLRLGIAVRLSQNVDLNSEPPPGLTSIECEERRRTFWSTYILDKLMSGGKSCPAAISDHDCTLQLPCDDATFHNGQSRWSLSLQQMLEWNNAQADYSSLFGLAIMSCSIFGRCTRFVHGSTRKDILPPWDPKSEFTAINASLFLLESMLDKQGASAIEIVRYGLSVVESTDSGQTGHLIFSHAMFHLCQCLINHPFIMRTRLRPIATRVPKSFVRHSFRLAQDHARQLTDLLSAAAEGSVTPDSSFYTYCAAISGGIHCIADISEREGGDVEHYDARQYYEKSMNSLERLARPWPMATHMKNRVKQLEANGGYYRSLFDPNNLAEEIDPASERLHWSLVDHHSLAKEGD